jgi:hypothetical protein
VDVEAGEAVPSTLLETEECCCCCGTVVLNATVDGGPLLRIWIDEEYCLLLVLRLGEFGGEDPVYRERDEYVDC